MRPRIVASEVWLLLAVSTASACFDGRRFRVESCLRGELGASCFASFREFTEGEAPEAALTMFRRVVAAQLASCDATYLRTGDGSGVGSSGQADLCQAFAAMRLGARVPLAPEGRGPVAELQARAEPLVALDFEKGMGTLQAMCEPGDRGHPLACARLGLLARAEGRQRLVDWYFQRSCESQEGPNGDAIVRCRDQIARRPEFAGWPDATVRAVVARGLIARVENAPPADPSEGPRMLLAAQALLASSEATDDRSLGQQLTGRVRASARDEFEALRATVERPAAARRTLEASFYSLEHMWQAIPRMEEPQRATARAAFEQTLELLVRDESRSHEGRGWFGRALGVFDEARRLGEVGAARRRMRSDLVLRAVAFHRERADRNVSAGRFLAARFHAGLVRSFGGPFDLAAIDARVREVSGGGRAMRYDPARCPWATTGIGAPTSGPTPPGAMEVSIQWTRCASSERRW